MVRKTLLISISAFLIAMLSFLWLTKFANTDVSYVKSEWLMVFTAFIQVIFIFGLFSIGIILLGWVFNFLGELYFRRNYSKFVSDIHKANEVCLDIRNGQLTVDEAQRKHGVPAYMIHCALNMKLEEEITSLKQQIKILEEKLSAQKNLAQS